MKPIIKKMAVVLAVTAGFWSCEPAYIETDTFESPDPAGASFTITAGSNEFEYILKNTSSVVGIAQWDLGNGSKASGDEVKVNYRIAGTYTITLNIYTKGGSVSVSKDHTQTVTDFSIFTDPVYINLSGGVDALNGKTWVLDSLTKGHLGVGPAGSAGLDWWSADPLAKANRGMYDDELNLNINEFKATYVNHGISYVKDFRRNDPAYSNPVLSDVDYEVNYTTPVVGQWDVVDKAGVKYLVLTAATPIFPNFDTGAKNGEYKILAAEPNRLELVCAGGDGNAWHYQLIPKGYARPVITFDLTVNTTANLNEYVAQLTNVAIPSGLSIVNVTWNFGDGATVSTTDHTLAQTHTYMRKGTYTLSVKVEANEGVYNKSTPVPVANNHPSYQEYLLDVMVMYYDFGETMFGTLGFDASGGTGSIATVNNPDNSLYPNRSAKCGFYTKTNNQWANVFWQLPVGYRFDLRQQSTFRILVYGTAGHEVLLKLENTDRGGNAWQTGCELKYTIQSTNKWEIMEYDFTGVPAGWDWTGDIYTTDVTTDDRFNHDFYNVVRIMLNPGNDAGTFSFHLDDLAGPHVEGLK